MITTFLPNSAKWELHVSDDPQFVRLAERLVTAAAALAELRHISVVRIDNWFGPRWLGYPTFVYRVRNLARRGWAGGGCRRTKLRPPRLMLPPFHPNRVLSETRFELQDDGAVLGPFEPTQRLHRRYAPNVRLRSFEKACQPGVYAWCSGNTTKNDRSALMVYTHSSTGILTWYFELHRKAGWRLAERMHINDGDWQQLLEIGRIRELQ